MAVHAVATLVHWQANDVSGTSEHCPVVAEHWPIVQNEDGHVMFVYTQPVPTTHSTVAQFLGVHTTRD